jgi:hypothetical protein
MSAMPAQETMRPDAPPQWSDGGASATDTKENPVRRTRRTVMALTAMGLLFVASACGEGEDSQATLGSESATPAGHSEAAAPRQSAKSNAGATGETGDSGTTSTTAAEGDDSDSTAQTTSTSTTSTTEPARPAEPGQPSEVCGESGPDIAPLRGRPQDAPPECVELGTGDVQVTLRWASSADIDLHVTEPDGTEIWYGDKGPTSTGGQLDVDSNVGCDQEASVENIFWPTGQAPSGQYTVEVNGYQVDGCGSGDYTVTAKVRGEQVLLETGSVGEDETDTYHIEA